MRTNSSVNKKPRARLRTVKKNGCSLSVNTSQPSDKAAELQRLYINLGFTPPRTEAPSYQRNLAPVSFLPYVEYTITTIPG